MLCKDPQLFITDLEGTVGYIFKRDGKEMIILKETLKTNRKLILRDINGKEVESLDIPEILLKSILDKSEGWIK